MSAAQLVARRGEIAPQMDSGRQKIRDHQDAIAPRETQRSPPVGISGSANSRKQASTIA